MTTKSVLSTIFTMVVLFLSAALPAQYKYGVSNIVHATTDDPCDGEMEITALPPPGARSAGPFTVEILYPDGHEETLGPLEKRFTLTGLCAGHYFVCIENNYSCRDCEDVIIEDCSDIRVQSEIRHDCGPFKGKILLTVMGGEEPYEYVWHKGDCNGEIFSHNRDVYDLDKGRYCVEISDQRSCLIERTFDLKGGAPFTAEVTQTIDCKKVCELYSANNLDGAYAELCRVKIWCKGDLNSSSVPYWEVKGEPAGNKVLTVDGCISADCKAVLLNQTITYSVGCQCAIKPTPSKVCATPQPEETNDPLIAQQSSLPPLESLGLGQLTNDAYFGNGDLLVFPNPFGSDIYIAFKRGRKGDLDNLRIQIVDIFGTEQRFTKSIQGDRYVHLKLDCKSGNMFFIKITHGDEILCFKRMVSLQ